MGSEDLFKKRRESRKKREYEQLQPKSNSFLIVTEGEKSEPLYLKGLVNLIKTKIGGNVEVVQVPHVDIIGEGCSTCKLIEKTDEIVKCSKIIYQNIWVVFDKDDFSDFDEAISSAERKGYKVAWNNQSFEYWAYLHFHYSDSALHRDEWCKKLDQIFCDHDLGEGKYQKNYSNMYDLLNTKDGVNTAIRYAKRRMSSFNVKNMKPSDYDPGTTMHFLVSELNAYI